jgi:biopolymer transport protein ExbD
MMKRKTTETTKFLKVVALIPVFGLMIYFFSEKVPAQNTGSQKRTVSYNSEEKLKNDNDLRILLDVNGKVEIDGKTYQKTEIDKILSENDLSSVSLNVKKGAPMGEISDIQKLLYENGAGHIDVNILGNEGEVSNQIQDTSKAIFYKDFTFKVVGKDGSETTKKFEDLTEKQKAFLMLPKTPEKKTPSEALFTEWKNPEKYAVWVDGVNTSADQLKKIYRIHIVYFINSFVHLNARSIKFPQEHQVSIYTEEGFEKAFGENSEFLNPRKKTMTIKES